MEMAAPHRGLMAEVKIRGLDHDAPQSRSAAGLDGTWSGWKSAWVMRADPQNPGEVF